MNSKIQLRIAQLVEKGWTLAAIADELGVTSDTVELWRAGKRNPTNARAVLLMLDKVLKKKRIPKQKRYAKGSRQKQLRNKEVKMPKVGDAREAKRIVCSQWHIGDPEMVHMTARRRGLVWVVK